MKTTKLNPETDYSQVVTWWKKQDWEPLPLDFLPETGYIIKDGSQLLAATWVYQTNSKVAILEWTVGNPELDWQSRDVALNQLLADVIAECKDAGFSYVFTMTKHERFIERLRGFNLQTTDDNMTHLVGRI